MNYDGIVKGSLPIVIAYSEVIKFEGLMIITRDQR
jgi:hypothetical protein